MLLRVVLNAVALWAAAFLVPGIHLVGDSSAATIVTALAVALVFGVLNALVKPLLVLLGMPLIAVTLGLFLIVVNALMLMLTSWASGLLGLAFSVDGFVAALLGAIVVSAVAWLLSAFTRE